MQILTEKHIKTLFFLLICCFSAVIFSCNPSGKYTREADHFYENQQYEDASTYYYNALLKNPNNKKAQQGLKLSAQQVLNQKFNVFRQLVLENKIEEAIKQYQNSEQFAKNAETVGVKLDWPTEYNEVYQDIKTEYIATLYEDALSRMNQKRYDVAEKIFTRIASMDSNYRNVSVLRLNTVMEPLYNDGVRLLKAGKYKEAYAIFNKIIQFDDTYKDVKARRDEALAKATLNLGILPVLADNQYENQAKAIENELKRQFQQRTYAFAKVVSSDELRNTLENRGWGKITNEEKAMEAAANVGLQFVLFTHLESVTDSFVPRTSETRVAYEAFTENILNPYTGTYSYISKFKKVSYEDSYEAIRIHYILTYSLLDCRSKKFIVSDKIDLFKNDELHKFTYSGNISNLYDELPQGNYLPPVNQAWRDQFTEAKRTLQPKDLLDREAQKEIAQRLAFVINKNLK